MNVHMLQYKYSYVNILIFTCCHINIYVHMTTYPIRVYVPRPSARTAPGSTTDPGIFSGRAPCTLHMLHGPM